MNCFLELSTLAPKKQRKVKNNETIIFRIFSLIITLTTLNEEKTACSRTSLKQPARILFLNNVSTIFLLCCDAYWMNSTIMSITLCSDGNLTSLITCQNEIKLQKTPHNSNSRGPEKMVELYGISS